ncbi:MAG: hypothetical protein ACI8PQ_000378, partial [Planctomycetota bacterium]
RVVIVAWSPSPGRRATTRYGEREIFARSRH